MKNSNNQLFGMALLLMIAGSLFWLSGCGGTGKRDVDPIWKSEIVEKRREKDLEFKTAEDSPMAASQRLTLRAEAASFVRETEDGIVVEVGRTDQTKFSLKKEEGGWVWEGLAPGVTCEIGGKKRTDRAELKGKSDIRFHRYYIAAYPATDKLTLIVFDPTREELRRFNHLLYYDPDPDYAVEAVLRLFDKPESLTMLTSQNLEKTFYRC